MAHDHSKSTDHVVAELRGADGELKARHDSATSTDDAAATTTQKESK